MEVTYRDRCGKERSWLFSDLGEEGQRELEKVVKSIEYEKGEIIFQEGEPAFGLYIICEGRVKLAKRSSKGKRQILKLLGPGEILGEKTMFDQETYTAYAKTLERTRVKFIERETFLSFLNKHPSVALKLIEKLSRELKGFQNKLIEASYEGSTARLARLLLMVGQECGVEEQEGLYIGVELSRAELAEMAGISTETAIRTLSRLKDRRLIALDGHKIYLLDMEGLEKLTEPFLSTLKENLL